MPPEIDALVEHFPTIIGEMDDDFSSHEFIKRLMWRQQRLFISALLHYQDDTPFTKVHNQLSQKLLAKTDLVTFKGKKDSFNVFGRPGRCAIWKKVGTTPVQPNDPNSVNEE